MFNKTTCKVNKHVTKRWHLYIYHMKAWAQAIGNMYIVNHDGELNPFLKSINNFEMIHEISNL